MKINKQAIIKKWGSFDFLLSDIKKNIIDLFIFDDSQKNFIL